MACTPSPSVSIQINQTNPLSLTVGQTSTLTATVSNTGNQAVTWSSSNPAVASVNSSSGLVSALAVGSTTITARSAADTSKTSSITVQVNAATGVKVSLRPQGPLNLTVGQTYAINATVQNTSDTRVTWSSSAPNTVSVSSSGVLNALSNGSATITATSVADTAQSAQISVQVSNLSGGSNSISGTISVSGTTAQAIAAPFVAGELIVRFKSQVSLQSVRALSAGPIQMQQVRSVGSGNSYLYRANLDRTGTIGALRALEARADIAYVEPNYILKAFATPNDPRFGEQWHYTAINLPQAWDIAKGDGVRVAVVDSGIFSAHADFAGKLLPGYDFVSDSGVSGDGDGRDNNPEDTGTNSDFHGTHVTGTVGAATNNSLGIAGVGWNVKILPVRALSTDGGTLADVADALRWAAGLSVSGVPANANAADIINMSLGGENTCAPSSTMQQAINDVIAAGKIIVVAAGNSNTDASTFTPAGCSGVVTVGATNRSGNRAFYSNFGNRIDVMAPGGDTSSNQADGILSTVNANNYGFKMGTSMAAPHVAGVLALMKSRRASLTAAEAISILKATSRPLSATQCNRSSGADCGKGLIDAKAAIDAVGAPPAPTLSLTATPTNLTLYQGSNATFAIGIARANFSGDVSLSLGTPPTGITGTFSPSTTSNASSSLSLSVASSTALGSYTLIVSGSGGGVSAETKVTLNVVAVPPAPPVGGTVKDVKIYFDEVTNQNPLTITPDFSPLTLSQDGLSAPYVRSGLNTGSLGYRVSAWKDVNGDGTENTGDLFGWYFVNGAIATVPVNSSNINIRLEPVLDTTYTRSKMLQEQGK